jgi:serine/threonine-protein kinase HipA
MGVLREQIDMSHSVENEWLCLKICKAYGIPTASAEIADFNGVRALIVERFDREFNQHSVLRYAQEDFCQVAGAPSHKKYENEGGPGILQIMKTLTKSDNPTSDKRLFMTSQIVFWLLAAIDGHAKNFSIFLMPGGIKLTPLYDVMSAHPPIAKKQIPFEKAKLAMAVGTNRHYKIREITKRHWLQTAKMAQFSEHETEGIIENLKSQTDEVIAAVTAQLPKGFPKEVSKPIFDGLSKMAKILK